MLGLLFVLYVVAEVGAFALVAHFVGWAWAFVALIACSAAGTVLVAAQGRRAIERLRGAVQGGGSPGRAVADGAMVAVGGVLMFVPGFVTSLLGALLLVPPTRTVLRPVLVWLTARRFGPVVTVVSVAGTRVRRQRGSAEADVIEGEVIARRDTVAHPVPMQLPAPWPPPDER